MTKQGSRGRQNARGILSRSQQWVCRVLSLHSADSICGWGNTAPLAAVFMLAALSSRKFFPAKLCSCQAVGNSVCNSACSCSVRKTFDIAFEIELIKPEFNIGYKGGGKRTANLRTCIHNLKRRLDGSFSAILRCIFLKYTKYSCENAPCLAKKSLAQSASSAVNTGSKTIPFACFPNI